MKNHEYFRTDLFPQEIERLQFTGGTLSKVDKLLLKPQRECITHRFKETCFWDYVESYRLCPGYHYFNTILEKFIDKPLSGLISKCRKHPLYTKHKGFRHQVDMKIKELMDGPVMCERYSGSNFWEDYFTDYEGVIRKIEDHPLYHKVPKREAIAWTSWRNPNEIVTTSRKRILRTDEGIHVFVPDFEIPSKNIITYNKVGKPFLKLNPEYTEYKNKCIPLTPSELSLYRLHNTSDHQEF